RMLWTWPEPLPFRLGQRAPGTAWAIRALDRLRELDLQPSDPPSPIMVPLTATARGMIEAFGQRMQDRQSTAAGLLRSAYGKAPGRALRRALVIEMLKWCGEAGSSPPPARISSCAFAAAALMMQRYFMPMAERVYGATGGSVADRGVETLARWILKTRPIEVH